MAKADMDTVLDHPNELESLRRAAAKYFCVGTVLEEHGSGGGCPLIRWEGPREALLDFLMKHYHDGASTREEMAELHVKG